MINDITGDLGGGGTTLLLVAIFLIVCIWLGVRIVPQSEKHVVERFGRLSAVLGPGINFIVPFLDRVAHKVSVLERQLPTASQDAITLDNVLVKVDTSVFYRILEPERPSTGSATSTARSPRPWPASCEPRSARWNSTRFSRTGPP
jgi:regulator of protease activity HflC (stomatin/prohibitin superfamily)